MMEINKSFLDTKSDAELEEMLDKAEHTGFPVDDQDEFTIRLALQKRHSQTPVKKEAPTPQANGVEPTTLQAPDSQQQTTDIDTQPFGFIRAQDRRTEVSPTYAGRYNFMKDLRKRAQAGSHKK